jgi:hypothetical protein
MRKFVAVGFDRCMEPRERVMLERDASVTDSDAQSLLESVSTLERSCYKQHDKDQFFARRFLVLEANFDSCGQ